MVLSIGEIYADEFKKKSAYAVVPIFVRVVECSFTVLKPRDAVLYLAKTLKHADYDQNKSKFVSVHDIRAYRDSRNTVRHFSKRGAKRM